MVVVAKPGELTLKQAAFVHHFIVNKGNGTQAALAAGYSVRGADVRACQLLGNIRIQEAVQKQLVKVLKRWEISEDRTMEELAGIGYSDIADLVKFDGTSVTFKNWDDVPAGVTRAIQEITIDTIPKGSGEDKHIVTRTKLKLHSKVSALKTLIEQLKGTSEVHLHKHDHYYTEDTDGLIKRRIEALKRAFPIDESRRKRIPSRVVESGDNGHE